MKAALVREPYGTDNLNVEDIEDPVPAQGEVLVGVKLGTLNPIDVTVTFNRTVYGIKPVPHVPGSEIYGIVESEGKRFKKGDRVIVYPRIFDGTCEYCLAGKEYLCTNGGLLGVTSNGGFCQRISVHEKNLVKLESDVSDEMAASLTVSALTAYHALRRANVSGGQKILIYGASGNTGIFAVQIAKSLGLEVHAVSRKGWIKQYGAEYVYGPDSIPVDLQAEVVLNSIGSRFWESSIKHVSRAGSLVSFGVQTGAEAKLAISNLYTRELNIVGSTGGTRKELNEVINLARMFNHKVPVQKTYTLENIKDAIQDFEKRESGRILIKI